MAGSGKLDSVGGVVGDKGGGAVGGRADRRELTGGERFESAVNCSISKESLQDLMTART